MADKSEPYQDNKNIARALQLEQARWLSAVARTDLVTCWTGNFFFRKLQIGKVALGSSRLGKWLCESIQHLLQQYGGDAINGFRPLAFVGLNDKLYRFSVLSNAHLIKNSHFCLNLISFS